MGNQYDQNLLLGYVEEELSPEQRAQVERWMAEDDHLARLLRAMMADRHLLQDVEDPAPPDWVMDEVEQQLERVMLVEMPVRDSRAVVIRQRHAMRQWMVGLGVAAMFALVAGVVISSLLYLDNREVALLEENERQAKEQQEDEVGDEAQQPMIAVTEQPEEPAPMPPTPVAVQEPVKQAPEVTPPISPAQADTVAVAPVQPAPAPMPTPPAADAVAVAPAPSDAGAAAPTPGPGPGPGAVMPHPQVHAGVGDTSRERLLDEPPPVGRSAIAELLSTTRRIQDAPATAPQYELRIVARDQAAVDRWFRQHDAASDQDPDRRGVIPMNLKPVKPKAPLKKAKADDDTPQPRHYELTMPAARLNDLVQELLRDPSEMKVRLVRRAVLAAGEIPTPPGSQVAPPLWPSLDPDYSRFLQQQLPEFASPEAAPKGPVTVTLPLVIEAAPTDQ